MNEIELLESIKELKKEKKRWYEKIYRFENREKAKEYYQKNKEKLIENSRNYRLENKEKCRKYRLENKEKLKKYNKTPAGYKSHKIATWKNIGVISNNFDKLFEKYLKTTNCENCNILLTKDRRNTSTTKVLDHCHISGEFRNVLCMACNTRRG